MLLFTSNCDRIIQVLERNFGNPTKVSSLHEHINKFPIVSSSKLFLEFSNLVENTAVTLENFGKSFGILEGRSLVKMFVSKLPDYLKMQWAIYMNENKLLSPNVSDLSDWVNIQNNVVSLVEIGNLSNIKPVVEENKNEFKILNDERVKFDKKQDADSKNQHSKMGLEKTNPICKLCKNENHPIDKCVEFIKC